MAVNRRNARIIFKKLKEEKIKMLTDEIPANPTSIFFYVSLLESKYKNIDVAMVNTESNSDVAKVLVAVANGKSDEDINLLVSNMLFPHYVGIIWDSLQKSGIDMGLSRDALEFQIDAARKEFPDIAPALALCECPITLQQAIESLLSCNDNRLSRFLEFIRETYVDDEDKNDIISIISV